MDPLKDKALLEDALKALNSIQQKRMRLEGQYEAAMEALSKLGFSGIQEAATSYRAMKEAFETDAASTASEVEKFIEEFNSSFSGVLND